MRKNGSGNSFDDYGNGNGTNGIGSTYSTTYYEPFHVARVFATLDLMSKGRAAWNIVTSLNDGEAMNMGTNEVVDHDKRYDRADEFMEVVLGHWNSWEDGAILNDKINNRFANPKKIHRLDFEGNFSTQGAIYRPAFRAGAPSINSSRSKRTRPAVCCSLG